MTVSFSHALIVGAVLVSCGALSAVWRRYEAGALAALPALAAGAAICAAGVTRFAAGGHDLETGQELAVLVCLMGLASSILGATLIRRRAAR